MLTRPVFTTIRFMFLSILVGFGFVSVANAAVPEAPESLSAVAGNTEVSVKWLPVSGAAEYVLYRAAAIDGPYVFVSRSQANGGADTGLTNGKTYYYVATAVNTEGQSPYSSPVAVTPTSTVLKAPADLEVIPGNGEVSLRWDAVTSAVVYNVYRISPNGEYTLLSPAAPGVGYTDRGVDNGIRYHYAVQTMSTNAGAYSTPVSAVPSESLSKAPETLKATPGSTWASLSWHPSEGATRYVVYRSTGIGGPYAFQAIVGDTSYEDAGLVNGTTYYYVVAAANENGTGAYSNEADARASDLERPRAVVLFARAGYERVDLSWDPAPGAVSYKVYRATTGGDYTAIETVTDEDYTDSGLSNGTSYQYVVDALNASPYVVRSNEVQASPVESMPAPANVRAVSGNTQATVTWDRVGPATSYALEIAESPGGDAVRTVSASEASHTATGLTNNQAYYFRVRANAPNLIATSSEVSAVPTAALPLAPTDLQARAGNTQISLQWDAVDGATGYQVYRRTPSGPWEPSPIATPAGCLFTDTGLVNGAAHIYNVAAVNGSGNGAWAVHEKEVKPSVKNCLAPANIAVTPGNTQATVTWDPAIGQESFTVEAAEYAGGPAVATSSGADILSRTITGLTNGQTYYFRVRNYYSPAASAYSVEVGGTPSVVLPLAPTGLQARAGNTQISLQWDAVDGATGYKVYRRTPSSPWSSGPITTPAGCLFTDTGLVNGAAYIYNVTAVNGSGNGAWAVSEKEVKASVKNCLAPTNIAVTPGNTQATVTWDPPIGQDSFTVEVAENAGGPAAYTSSGADILSRTITGLTNGRTYYFRVRHNLSTSASAYSVEVGGTPSELLPMAPTSLSNKAVGNTQVTLTWNAVDGATGYQVYRRAPSSPWSSSPVAIPAGCLFTDTGLVNGVTYHYLVAAANAAGTGASTVGERSSTPVEGPPLAPTNVIAFPGDTQATVTWDPVGDATGYRVFKSPSLDGPFSAFYDANSAPYVATGLTNGQMVYFCVQADNGALSAFSAPVGAMPQWPADTGNITGRISANVAGYDSLGVKNAAVSLAGTGFSTTTDSDGNFTLVNVPFGDYQIVVSAAGMERLVQDIAFDEQTFEAVLPQLAVAPSGDANGDGNVGLQDVIMILQITSGQRSSN